MSGSARGEGPGNWHRPRFAAREVSFEQMAEIASGKEAMKAAAPERTFNLSYRGGLATGSGCDGPEAHNLDRSALKGRAAAERESATRFCGCGGGGRLPIHARGNGILPGGPGPATLGKAEVQTIRTARTSTETGSDHTKSLQVESRYRWPCGSEPLLCEPHFSELGS